MYCMRLAERLGYKTVDELYSGMSNDQIMEWVAYDRASDPQCYKKYIDDLSYEASLSMTIEERIELIKRMKAGVI